MTQIAHREGSDFAFAAIGDAARDTEPVSGLTHSFYRYPARFSPKLVRSVIEQFSAPGDLVADPFMGGGTTLVEALALGREAVGFDVSALATFVAEVKTTVYEDRVIAAVKRWRNNVEEKINMRRISVASWFYETAGYYRNINTRTRWRLRKAIEQALESTKEIRHRKARALGRCIILRTAQWALDGRRNLPSINEFRRALGVYADEMIEGAWELRRAVDALPERSRSPVHCVKASAMDLAEYFEAAQLRKPKLIITSPPYPGIHVLYHRWQVDGRKETPAPFWIVDKLDGAGSSYYTMGDRKYPKLGTYFTQLSVALTSIASICDEHTVVVQVVGFSEPDWQLPEYLAVTEAAGLTEVLPPAVHGLREGRLWRSVPNRKWHADKLGEIPASQEVVLFHRLAL
jgi:DNA modification methylase